MAVTANRPKIVSLSIWEFFADGKFFLEQWLYAVRSTHRHMGSFARSFHLED